MSLKRAQTHINDSIQQSQDERPRHLDFRGPPRRAASWRSTKGTMQGLDASLGADASDRAQAPTSTGTPGRQPPHECGRPTGCANGSRAGTNLHDTRSHRRLVLLARWAKKRLTNGGTFGSEWLAPLRSRSGMRRPRRASEANSVRTMVCAVPRGHGIGSACSRALTRHRRPFDALRKPRPSAEAVRQAHTNAPHLPTARPDTWTSGNYVSTPPPSASSIAATTRVMAASSLTSAFSVTTARPLPSRRQWPTVLRPHRITNVSS